MRRIALACLLLLCASIAEATTYYVRTDGSNANAGTSNSSGGAWLTITKGCQTAAAGDTVRVQSGTYVEKPSGCTSGSSSSNTVTLVADGTVTACGMSFASKSYIRVIGFTFDMATGGCSQGDVVTSSGTNTGLEFWNVTVGGNGNTRGYAFGNGTFRSGEGTCSQCIWFGGSISNIGGATSGTALELTGSDTYVAYEAISNVCYIGVSPSGLRLRFVNVNFSAMVQCNGTHPDFFYGNVQGNTALSLSNMLVEGIFGIGTTTASDNKFQHMQNDPSSGTWADNVERLNVSYNLGAQYLSQYPTSAAESNWRIYHNTIVNCMRAAGNVGQNYCGTVSSASFGMSMSLYNNLYQQAWGDSTSSNEQPYSPNGSPTITADYNLGFSPNGSVTFTSPWTLQAHPKNNVDPKLNNVAGNDFTLQSASGARGIGGPVTTATSCSGTTLNVATGTGSFFVGDNSANLAQYGGALDPGDTLTLVSTPHKVVSVSGDAITLDASVSCSNGDAVYFDSSITIDIGAYPYKAGGYTLSASYVTSGTETVTPNDASLVRFVVCYNDNVPYAVVNASPYTCSIPSGAFTAYAYPRYPSQTQSVQATFSSGTANSKPLIVIIRSSAFTGLLAAFSLYRNRRVSRSDNSVKS